MTQRATQRVTQHLKGDKSAKQGSAEMALQQHRNKGLIFQRESLETSHAEAQARPKTASG